MIQRIGDPFVFVRIFFSFFPTSFIKKKYIKLFIKKKDERHQSWCVYIIHRVIELTRDVTPDMRAVGQAGCYSPHQSYIWGVTILADFVFSADSLK